MHGTNTTETNVLLENVVDFMSRKAPASTIDFHLMSSLDITQEPFILVSVLDYYARYMFHLFLANIETLSFVCGIIESGRELLSLHFLPVSTGQNFKRSKRFGGRSAS